MAYAARDKKISKNEYAVHIVIFLIMFVIGHVAQFTMRWSENLSIQHAVQTIILLNFFLPLIIAYIINKKGDGLYFWYRFVSISIPIIIILLLLEVFVFFLYSTIFYFFSPSTTELPTNSWDYIYLYIVSLIVQSMFIYKSMRIASGCHKGKGY